MQDFKLIITCKNNELGIHEENGRGCLCHGLSIEDVKAAIANYLETNYSENVRYIKFSGGSSTFDGMDFEEYRIIDLSVTDAELGQMAVDYAEDNAAQYEDIEVDYCIYRENYDNEEDYHNELEEAEEDYYENIWSDWIEVSKEEYLKNR